MSHVIKMVSVLLYLVTGPGGSLGKYRKDELYLQ